MDMKKLHYLEFPATHFNKTRDFFSQVFNWSFEDYGPDYMAFTSEAGLGGFYRSNQAAKVENGSVLVVLYHDNLEVIRQAVINANGKIIKDIFSFPGGRRFHFVEPSGNEIAVWSDQ